PGRPIFARWVAVRRCPFLELPLALLENPCVAGEPPKYVSHRRIGPARQGGQEDEAYRLHDGPGTGEADEEMLLKRTDRCENVPRGDAKRLSGQAKTGFSGETLERIFDLHDGRGFRWR